MVFAASAAWAQCENLSKDGDPAFIWGFPGPEVVIDIYAGQTLCFEMAPANLGHWEGVTCPEIDTFCVHIESMQGWMVTGEHLDECYLLNAGYLTTMDACITAPCDVEVCDYDTVYAWNVFCDDTLACRVDCGDCIDPNVSPSSGNAYYYIDTLYLHVVAAPPALYIVQDSLYEITFGQTAAYVPFDICNGDPCADPTQYGYLITQTHGTIPGVQDDVNITVAGGECGQVFWIANAGATPACTEEELTIIAWAITGPVAYDTCVQIVHVVERKAVPLFTAPVVTILVLAMILTAAVFMRRRAVSRV
jgi:hypothetical protein